LAAVALSGRYSGPPLLGVVRLASWRSLCPCAVSLSRGFGSAVRGVPPHLRQIYTMSPLMSTAFFKFDQLFFGAPRQPLRPCGGRESVPCVCWCLCPCGTPCPCGRSGWLLVPSAGVGDALPRLSLSGCPGSSCAPLLCLWSAGFCSGCRWLCLCSSAPSLALLLGLWCLLAGWRGLLSLLACCRAPLASSGLLRGWQRLCLLSSDPPGLSSTVGRVDVCIHVYMCTLTCPAALHTKID